MSGQTHPITGSAAGTWQLKVGVVFNPIDTSSISNSAANVPDTSATFASLSTAPNLTTYALQGRTSLAAAKTQATTLMNSSRTGIIF